MRWRAAFPLILALAALCLGAAGAPVTIGERHSLRSAVLNEERSYQIALPDSYRWAQDRRYPVLYVLDGDTHFAHTAGSVGFLAAQGEIPEMIVVAISSTKRVRDFTQTDWPTAWIGGGGAGNFRKFLSTELLPAIDRDYRTDGFRVLSGHSAGGQFVLYCLTSEPGLFAGYFALSPSLNWDDNLPLRSLEEAFGKTPTLPGFLYFARSDDGGKALADDERLDKILQTKSPQGFRWRSRPFPDETHVSVPLLAQIDALRSLYSGYRLHQDMMDKGLPYAEQHFQTLSKTLGRPMPIPERVINDLAYAALQQDKTQEAIDLFRRNVDANPRSANAYDGLADGYEKAGRLKEAAAAADRAAALAAEVDHPHRAYFVEHARKLNEQLKQAP